MRAGPARRCDAAGRGERHRQVDDRRGRRDGVRALAGGRVRPRAALDPAPESALHEWIRLERAAGAPRWGFFLRAETMHGFYSYLEDNPGTAARPRLPRAEPRRVVPRRAAAPASTPPACTASTSPRPRCRSPRRSRWWHAARARCRRRAGPVRDPLAAARGPARRARSSRSARGACARRRTTSSSWSRTGAATSTPRCGTCATSSDSTGGRARVGATYGGQRVKTILPKTSPSAIAAKPVARPAPAAAPGRSPGGRRSTSSSSTRAASSSRVPIVEPITRSCRKKIRVSSASSRFGPLVAPEIDERAAGPQRLDRVRPGRLADGLHDRVDPLRAAGRRSRTPRGRRARGPARAWPRRGWSRTPAARRRAPSAISAVATPPPAPCTSTRVAGLEAALGEEHPVGRQPGGRQAGGLLEATARRAWAPRCGAGTTTLSANVPW